MDKPKIGDVVKAYDFWDDTSSYVIGRIVDIKTAAHDCPRYKIKVFVSIMQNSLIENQGFVFTPVNGILSSMRRTTHFVEVL